jgi:hypothetical protein
MRNSYLKCIFGLKRDEVPGGWRKLHNEELHNLYSLPSIIRTRKSRRMRWAGHVARMWRKRGAYSILIGKPAGNRPLGRQRCRWVESIQMNLREIGWGGLGWSDLVQEGSCEHGNECSGSIKCLEFLEYLHNKWLLKKGSSS